MNTDKETNKIKEIITKLLDEGEDFNTSNAHINQVLNEIDGDKGYLENNKLKLLNILLKHSKKKILFEWEIKKGSRDYTLIIGLNEKGLGMVNSNWGHNLINISDYSQKDTFKELIQDENFIRTFLRNINKHLKGKHKKEIGLCLALPPNKTIEEEQTKFEDVTIELSCSSLNYYVGRTENSYGHGVSILGKNEDKEGLDYGFSFKDLDCYCKVIGQKKKIIRFLNSKVKEFTKIKTKTKTKLDEVNKYLLPYEALEKI